MSNIFKVLFYILLLIILSVATFFMIIYTQATRETSELIERGAVKNTIFSESPVYYDDEVTPIGVFFEKTHSQYTNYQDIPRIYIKAIIAAEDKNFFRHHGFDVRAIIRAFITNFKAGRVVQGGSTITQQTAKNIFNREKKTYLVKLKELIQAMLLEKNYTKEEILEIYINQFFVTGFGKGLGVASEYFFNKKPEDLNLVEAAFLAGMVKGPSRYNPFTCRTEDDRKKAEGLAKERKDYVLDRMRELNLITEDAYIEARLKEVPFNEGKVTYGLNVIMDYVRLQLESDYFKTILSDQGLENIATSGINIYTSVSQAIQKGALNSLRTNLPELDIQLTGYDNTLNKERYIAKMGVIYNRPVEDLPFFGIISGINNDLNNIFVEVEWENNGKGIIDYEGLKTMGEAWMKWKYGAYAQFDKKYALEFLRNLHVGDSVPVILTQNEGPGSSANRLFLWEIPELEGGIIVLNNGMIKAMSGGFFDRHFNRAADAKRQLGSIFKPIVYTAALQLKWNNLDTLTNMDDLYAFESTYYIPRPDHDPDSNNVSMIWAGVKSENLASVWLLYHLTDRLNLSEFKGVTEKLGLARKESETYNEYVERIRDRHGVIVDETSLMEAAFESAKNDIESDLIFEGNEKAIENLNRMHFNINEERLIGLGNINNEISRFSFTRLKRINSSLKYSVGSDAAQDIWVDGLLPSRVIDLLQENIDKRYRELMRLERYDIDVLCQIRDFRTMVNLYYVRALAYDMGISTPLDAVLSFPLGANSISILEAALVYDTMMTGKIYAAVDGETTGNMTPIITKITDRKGAVIWEYSPAPERVLSGGVSGSVTEILRMVVDKGTARRAKDSVRLSVEFDRDVLDLTIPCFGKTGTSNQFSNSSFAGFIPAIQKGEFSVDKGYVIAAYVGYDDNRPMKGQYLTVYGSSGALPLWIDTANAIVNNQEYKKDVEIADLAFNVSDSPLTNVNMFEPVRISAATGLPVSGEGTLNTETVNVYSNIGYSNNEITLNRIFEPLKGVEPDDNQR